MSKLCLTAAILLTALPFSAVFGDDTSSGVMLPGLRSTEAGSIKVTSSSLKLSPDHLEVTLKLTVTGKAASLTLHTPSFGWLGESETYPDRQFPELRILSNAVPLKLEESFTARLGAVDISEDVRKAGLDPFAVAATPPFVKQSSSEAFSKLLHMGAIEKADAGYLAKWTVERSLKIPLNEGSRSLTLDYKPRPALALMSRTDLNKPTFRRKYCASSEKMEGYLGHAKPDQMVAVSEYSIPVAINGQAVAGVSVTSTMPATLYCGTSLSASTDSNGVVHILALQIN